MEWRKESTTRVKRITRVLYENGDTFELSHLTRRKGDKIFWTLHNNGVDLACVTHCGHGDWLWWEISNVHAELVYAPQQKLPTEKAAKFAAQLMMSVRKNTS